MPNPEEFDEIEDDDEECPDCGLIVCNCPLEDEEEDDA